MVTSAWDLSDLRETWRRRRKAAAGVRNRIRPDGMTRPPRSPEEREWLSERGLLGPFTEVEYPHRRASRELREAAARLARSFDAHLVVLFGSAARGEDAAEDIDIGILGSGPVDVVAVTNELTQGLQTQDVDVTDLSRADPILLALVAREGVPLFENEPGQFARFASLAARRFADTKKFRDAQAEALREITAGPQSS